MVFFKLCHVISIGRASLRGGIGVVAWLIIYRIMVIISTVSPRGLDHGIRKNLNKKTGCRGQAHYCTNV
ncbi:hypothetical protein [Rickettsia endosymbiont of Orchestes rusci]|uniref:hypothetical protein n=1 Tax=Rickettsia endosymbiont of Orchestes rusci TaxID=3066250 RepID=UPI00313E9794